MSALDYAGWAMVVSFLIAMWTIVAMVVYDPPLLIFRFIAPLLATSASVFLVLMAVEATS
jgi:hypothetical protein